MLRLETPLETAESSKTQQEQAREMRRVMIRRTDLFGFIDVDEIHRLQETASKLCKSMIPRSNQSIFFGPL